MAKATAPTDRLFPVKERTRLAPSRYAEPSYTYFDECARPECELARNLLEDWFSHYPKDGKAELRTRLQSDKEHNFRGAFFELYCYMLLTGQGFVAEPHPIMLRSKETHPDFLAYVKGRPAFYLESTVAQSRDYQTEQRLERLYDDLNRLRSSNFMLNVRPVGDIPKSNPPIRRIHRELRAWLDALDPDEVIAHVHLHGYKGLPAYVIRDGGWHLEFDAIPIRADRRGKSDADSRIVGSSMHVPNSSWVDMQQPLLAALQEKRAGKYGGFELPYIIAVNVRSEPLDDDHIAAALFGKMGVMVDLESDELVPTFIPPGFWTSKEGVHNTGVSAVLVVSLLDPLTVARHQPVLWHNPWAKNPLSHEVWAGLQKIPGLASGKMQHRDGTSASELLILDPEWPYIFK